MTNEEFEILAAKAVKADRLAMAKRELEELRDLCDQANENWTRMKKQINKMKVSA